MSGARVGELRRQIGFAFRQMIDVGGRRLVVAARFVAPDFRIDQPSCEIVAGSRRFGQLAVDLSAPIDELPGGDLFLPDPAFELRLAIGGLPGCRQTVAGRACVRVRRSISAS
jgi:hypothetical protein